MDTQPPTTPFSSTHQPNCSAGSVGCDRRRAFSAAVSPIVLRIGSARELARLQRRTHQCWSRTSKAWLSMPYRPGTLHLNFLGESLLHSSSSSTDQVFTTLSAGPHTGLRAQQPNACQSSWPGACGVSIDREQAPTFDGLA